MVKSCWICKTSGNKLKSYFRIPKILFHRNSQILHLSALRREKWHNILVLPDDTSGIRICSDHFLSGNPARLLDTNDPDWVPTQNLEAKPRNNVAQSKQSELNGKESVRNNKKIDKGNLHDNVLACRLCNKMKKEESCVNIFEDDKRVIQMMALILGHKIVRDERLSQYACQLCLKKIEICTKLLTFFRNNEKQLTRPYPSKKKVRDLDQMVNNEVVTGISKELWNDQKFHSPCKLGKSIDLPNSRVHEKENNSSSAKKLAGENGCDNEESCSFTVNENSVLYDKDQIRSIIEDNFISSDEEFIEDETLIKYEKRKYQVQAVRVRPVEAKTLKCNNCYKKFNDLNDLKVHKNFCKLFYCQLCKPQMIFKDKDEQLSHKKRFHSQSIVCHVCGKNYSQSYLLKHFKNHFEDRKKCPFCNKFLKNVTVLMTHVDSVHGNRLSSICEFCGAPIENLKKHLMFCRK